MGTFQRFKVNITIKAAATLTVSARQYVYPASPRQIDPQTLLIESASKPYTRRYSLIKIYNKIRFIPVHSNQQQLNGK